MREKLKKKRKNGGRKEKGERKRDAQGTPRSVAMEGQAGTDEREREREERGLREKGRKGRKREILFSILGPKQSRVAVIVVAATLAGCC